MDPISALGAASSAIGIASFALDLAGGLIKLSGQVRSAKDVLKSVGETVKATAFALEEIEKLLVEEETHIRQVEALSIFSITGLSRVKDTTNQCLVVLWKIEALICGSEEPDDRALDARLQIRSNTKSKSIQLDPKIVSPSLGTWDRLMFAVSTLDKLKEYGRELQSFQISLSLIFNVVTVAYLLSKSSLTEVDRRAVATAEKDLRRPRPNYRQIAQGILDNQTTTDSIHQSGNSSRDSVISPAKHPGIITQPRDVAKDSGMAIADPFITANVVPAGEGTLQYQATVDSSSLHVLRDVKTQDLDDDGDKMGNRDDATSAPGQRVGQFQGSKMHPMKVYTLQGRHGEWREERLTHTEISQRLQKLDQGKKTALDKKLGLSTEYQGRVDAIQTKVNDEEAHPEDYRWNLRQLELKKYQGRLVHLRLPRSLLAIIIYLQREVHQQREKGSQHPDGGALSQLNKRPGLEGPTSCLPSAAEDFPSLPSTIWSSSGAIEAPDSDSMLWTRWDFHSPLPMPELTMTADYRGDSESALTSDRLGGQRGERGPPGSPGPISIEHEAQSQQIALDEARKESSDDDLDVPLSKTPLMDAPLSESMLDDSTIEQLMALLTPGKVEQHEEVMG